jgi:hypothetical protein
MSTKLTETILYIVIIFSILALGFYFGRKTTKVKTEIKTEYIKGDTIRDTIYEPKPYKVVEPVDTLNIIKQCIKDGIYSELWPTRIITEIVEVTKEDTTKMLADWATKRLYNETIFSNDSLGYCSIEAQVQYNRLRVLGYEYQPITKTITETVYKVNKFSPFAGIGYMTNPWDEINNPMFVVNGGFFIKEKYGIQLQLMHAFQSKSDYVGGSFIYKF